MNSLDLLKLYGKEYPNFQLDLKSTARLVAEGNFESAAERFRAIAKKLLKISLHIYAVDFYKSASEYFIKCSKYDKAVNTQKTIYSIYRLLDSQLGMALTQDAIASIYRAYLNDLDLAGWHYILSVKHNQANQNYRSAYKRADLACKCYESSEFKNKEKIRTAHSLAFRTALQSGFYEKAGIHAQIWFDLLEKDYSSHYIAVCVKGYKSFLNTDRVAEPLLFVNELIKAHYERQVPQRAIMKYLHDGQKLTVLSEKNINITYNEYFKKEAGDKKSIIINYSVEMKSLCENNGLLDLSDFFYIQEMNYRKDNCLGEKKYLSYIKYLVWKIMSVYGTSFNRWIIASVFIIFFFGTLYSKLPIESINSWAIKPQIKITSIDNFFSPYYYSVVTLATLGYGDIVPSNLAGQITSVVEVLIGYIMLGGLLSIFSKKVTR